MLVGAYLERYAQRLDFGEDESACVACYWGFCAVVVLVVVWWEILLYLHGTYSVVVYFCFLAAENEWICLFNEFLESAFVQYGSYSVYVPGKYTDYTVWELSFGKDFLLEDLLLDVYVGCYIQFFVFSSFF